MPLTDTITYPLLIGDIGGTNARFAFVAEKGDAPIALVKRPVAGHAGPVEAMGAYLKAHPDKKPRTIILAVATRVNAAVVHLTNASWTIDSRQIGRAIGAESVLLMNDYAAVAMALPFLAGPDHLAPLGPELPGDAGARLVLGAGTGMGATALVPFENRFAVLPTEAGHTEFGAVEEGELALWPYLERVHDRVTSESLLSGPGILRLYEALERQRGNPPALVTPAEIVAAGMRAQDGPFHAALTQFAKFLGRFTGDLALIFSATGGVYMGGGIAPRMVEFLRQSPFRQAFERKMPFAEIIRQIPTFVITDREPALTGLTQFAAHSERFLITLHGWSASSMS
ncbi:glucokinase [Rhodoligotrophos appendicifer]|uniref:glucokinase n=1 Tax=Rhodoligotrophos appendicifer TaxID=987056 RepID=UPI0011857B1F|nr:glucokinase [Rhodoligotrophos appendicifer]